MSSLRYSAKLLGLFAAVVLAAATSMTFDPELIDAVRRGDVDAVRSLVRQGLDVNGAQGDGLTPLHLAATNGGAEIAEILVYAGANLEARTRNGAHTPLHVASRGGHSGVIEILLGAGADLAVRTTNGSTPLHFAAVSGVPSATEVLLDHGAEVDAREHAAGQTPLIYAASSNYLEAVKVLLAWDADPNAATTEVDIAARAIEDGEEKKLRNRRMTLLREFESDQDQEETEEDAEEEATEEDTAEEETAEEEAAEEEAAEEEAAEEEAAEEEAAEEEAAEEEAAEEEAAQEVDVLTAVTVIQGPYNFATMVSRKGAMTPLHHAVRQGHAEVVQALLEAGADVNRLSADGTSPLLIATINGHWDLGLFLLEHDADPNLAAHSGIAPLFATINLRWVAKTQYPQPLSHWNQAVNYLDYMGALIEAGADPNARITMRMWHEEYMEQRLVDPSGATPFWRAAYGLDVIAMRFLVEHGADPTIRSVRPRSGRSGNTDGPRRGSRDTTDYSGMPVIPVGGPSLTPLHMAAGAGQGDRIGHGATHRHVPGANAWMRAVRYLVEEVGLDVNARDHTGLTPLHGAAGRGDIEMIQYLVEHGADATFKARDGDSTADYANSRVRGIPPYPEATALLRSLGSDFKDDCAHC